MSEGSRSSVGVGVCVAQGVFCGGTLCFRRTEPQWVFMGVVWSSRELCATCWSIGRKASSCYSSVPSPTSSCVNCLGVVCRPLLLVRVCGLLSRIKWLAVCLLVCFVGRPAARGRGLYALSGRSRSGKAADSFRH